MRIRTTSLPCALLAIVGTVVMISGCGAPPPVSVETTGARVSIGRTSSSASSSESASPSESAASFLDRWRRAILATDVDAILEFYADSANVAIVSSLGRLKTGLAGVRSEYESMVDGVEFESVSLESLSVHERGNTAWATCEFRADTVRRSDASRRRLHVRTSHVLVRTAGAWRIVFEHSSPIAGVPRVERR